MKNNSTIELSRYSLLGMVALFVVFGIVLNLAGVAWVGGAMVGLGAILAGIAAFRFGSLTVW